MANFKRKDTMGYVLTKQYRVEVPEAVKQALGVQPGQMIEYEIRPDGQVYMVAAKQPDSPAAPVTAQI